MTTVRRVAYFLVGSRTGTGRVTDREIVDLKSQFQQSSFVRSDFEPSDYEH